MTVWADITPVADDDVTPIFVDEDDFNLLHQDIKNICERIMTLEALQPSGIPIGAACLWYGLAAEVPTDWYICDGLNGTLNLLDLFIMGASADEEVGELGGGTSHYHSGGDVASDGSHNHDFSVGTSTWNGGGTRTFFGSPNVTMADSHYHSVSDNTNNGGNHSHSLSNTSTATGIYPPYKRLYWIARSNG